MRLRQIFSELSRSGFSSVTERLKFGIERYLTAKRRKSRTKSRDKEAQRRRASLNFRWPFVGLCFCAFAPGLDSVADGALEVGAVVAAEGELFAVFHDDAILAVKPRLHLFDLVDLHDRGTMNAAELPRVELFFKTADRLAQQVTLLVVVDADVISFRLDAVNIVQR